jgi:hypothetical protein
MPKGSKKFSAVIFLMLIVFSSMYVSQLPSANAAVPSLQAKSLSFLSDGMGLKTDQYTVSDQSMQGENKNINIPQKDVNLNLASSGSNVNVTCSYVGDTLTLVYVSDFNGNLKLKLPITDTVDMAKTLLANYRSETGNAAYGDFASMLNSISVNQNSTKVVGNTKLDISASTGQQNTTTYTWTYIDSNGVLAERKNVILTYEDGAFKAFYNNWPLYTVADTKSNFSAEEATKLAIEASTKYSYNVTLQNGTELSVSNFSVASQSLGKEKLIYVNSVDQKFARGGNTSELYLAWYVPLGFDRFYPGDVSGLTVILWADSGEVCSMNRVITDSGFTSSVANGSAGAAVENPVPTGATQLPTSSSNETLGVYAAVGMMGFPLGACKLVDSGGNKKRLSKSWAIMVCLLMLSSALLFIVPKASATTSGRNSRIYGIGSYPNLGWGGYHNSYADSAEGVVAIDICNYIGNASIDAGYTTTNQWGAGTTLAHITSNTGADDQYSEGAIVFHVGHELGQDVYQDDTGAPVTPGAISAETGQGKNRFVLLWVCTQAPSGNTQNPGSDSMAAAWLHRYDNTALNNTDGDGFAHPDDSGQCYISFAGMSPMLSSDVPNSNGIYYTFSGWGDPGPCEWFVISFYYFALYEGYTVHQSLDEASDMFFGCPFSSSPLYTGYNSWWPGDDENNYWQNIGDENLSQLHNPGYYPMNYNSNLTNGAIANYMRVFGDSNIQLATPQQVHPVVEGYDDQGSHVYSLVYVGDQYNYVYGTTWSPFPAVTLGTHWVWAQDAPWYSSYSIEINGVTNGSGPVQYDFNSTPPTIIVNYVYDWSYGSLPGALMSISVGEEGGGTTDPTPSEFYASNLPDVNMTITAIPYTNYTFDHWSVYDYNTFTETNFTCNPLSIAPEGDLAVTAHFRYEPIKSLTILPSDNGTTDPPPGVHEYFGRVNVPATAIADTGYVLDNWTLDSCYYGSANTILLEMDHNMTLQPNFRLATTNYTITVGCGAYGNISQSGNISMLEGARFNVSASPDSGYWVEWLLDGNVFCFDQNLTYTVRSNQTLYANFVDYDPSVGGVSEAFETFGDCICGYIRGQSFNCTVDGYTDSVNASLLMGITNNVYYAEAAIYRLDNATGDYCLLAQVQTEINWTGQQWTAISFGQAIPLQSGQTYLVVLWSYQQDYNLWLASDTDYVNQYGFVFEAQWQNFEGHPPDFPTTLSGCYGGNSMRYSLYCPINPYPP